MTSKKTNNIIGKRSFEAITLYLEEIRGIEILQAEEEYLLAKKWKDQGDKKAANKLLLHHLQLVVKIAKKYKGYNLPLQDLISEGNVGMLLAIKNFNPDMGFRFSTYAVWWIKASIKEYIMKSWSLVKIGTTRAQRRLFFSLRKLKRQFLKGSSSYLNHSQMVKLAEKQGVSAKDIASMESRLNKKDFSLNTIIRRDDGKQEEWQNWLPDTTKNQEVLFAEKEELQNKKKKLTDALKKLNKREADIIKKRHLCERPMTLENIGREYGLSRERIRQIESKAFKKLQDVLVV